MRFKGYMRRLPGYHPEFVEFDLYHYKAAGVGYSPAIGMPVLEAHQLLNWWNSLGTRYVYWLP